MEKRHFDINKYISDNKKYGKEAVIEGLTARGYSIDFAVKAMKKRSIMPFLLLFVVLTCGIFFLNGSGINAMAVYDSGYEGLEKASADFSAETGIIYQGLAEEEKIFQEKDELNIQGKREGSLNIVDFNNDGEADIFTTGFFGDEVLKSDLYESMTSNTGDFIDVKGESCWADFDNNGKVEPAIIGNEENAEVFVVYRNKGDFNVEEEFNGILNGDIKCQDFNNDGWTDIVACGSGRLEYYENNEGELKLHDELEGIDNCRITVNDFNSDGKADFIIAGDFNEGNAAYIYTYGWEREKIAEGISSNGIGSADYNNDGWTDLAISRFGTSSLPETVFYLNNKGEFEEDRFTYFDITSEEVLFYSREGDLYLFISGLEKTGPGGGDLKAVVMHDISETANEKPNAPEGLSHSNEEHIKLEWEKAEDDHTEYPKYIVRAGTEQNSNSIISSVGQDAQFNTFRIIENLDECFFFQVKAVDSSLSKSTWSAKEFVNCDEEEIMEMNTTLEMPAPEEIIVWYHDRKFNNIVYHAEYEAMPSYTLVTETVTNEDSLAHDDVYLWHDQRFMIKDKGEYKLNEDNTFGVDIGYMDIGEKKRFTIKLQDNIEFNNVLPTQIDSEITFPVVERRNVTGNVSKKENKTIVKIDVEFNETVLAAEDVYVKQYIPKCLIEKINELVAKSNRKFEILNEDPLIMWYFEGVVEPEKLELEIDAVADENCTNQIRTEVIAKKLLSTKDEYKEGKAALQFLIPVILIGLLVWIIGKLREKKKMSLGLVLFSVVFIIYNIFDALSMLPESLDFLKKILSWMFMLALLYHISIKNMLFGKGKRKVKWYDIMLLAGFVMLSIKNIIYIAFKTYGEEAYFGDLALFIIRNSKQLAVSVYTIGAALFLAGVIFAWVKFRLEKNSFADMLHETEESLIHAKFLKLFVVFMLLAGFFIVFFNLLFDWFSIAFDGPLLVLILILSLRKISVEKTTEEPDLFIEKFMKLFTHRKNKFIAFSALPLVIFAIESYNYLAYILFGIKSIYFNAIEQEMPMLLPVIMNNMQAAGIYILQISALISAVFLAFSFWWHFYQKREKEGNEREIIGIKDRPNHPFAFSVLTAGFISYLVMPVFTVSSISNSRISGLFIMLKDSVAGENIFMIYMISFLPLLSYFIFRHYKKANILPYMISAFANIWFTVVFIIGFGDRAVKSMQGVTPIVGSFTAMFFVIFCFTLAYSVYSLLRELVKLFEEEYGHTKTYRIIARMFMHKIALPKEQQRKIKQIAEHLLDDGLEEYVVMEKISKATGFSEKEIYEFIERIEKEYEEKNVLHNANHNMHDVKHLETLHKYIHDHYWKKGIKIEDIIEHCLKHGWTQDDIAAASLHMGVKKKDKSIFKAMRHAL